MIEILQNGDFEGNGGEKRFELEGNRLIQFQAWFEAAQGIYCTIQVRFFGADGTLLQTRETTAEPGENAKAEIYTLSPALTSYIVASVGMSLSEPSEFSVTDASFKLVDPQIHHEPQIDLAAYGLPIWEGSTAYDEPVLLFAQGDEVPSAQLLYPPVRVLSVTCHPLRASFKEGADFTIEGNKIVRTPGSSIPFRRASDFPDTPFHYYEMKDAHLVVTYEHEDVWKGPAIEYKGEQLPGTMRKLRNKESLRIIAYGDSITRGLNVSSYDDIPPYMPFWTELFAGMLCKKYGYSEIHMNNAALPGAGSEWGASEVESHVTPLNPDLVLVSFGMNDFWSVNEDRFKAHIQMIIDKVRAHNPAAEFLLVSSMMYDPDYTNDENAQTYASNMRSYRPALESLIGPGIQLYDMLSVSEYLQSRKKPKDMLPNPLHPGDYLARWFAAGLAKALIPDREET